MSATVTLPNLISNKSKTARDKSKKASTNITTDKDDYAEFKSALEKINEIKIYLKQNFHKSDVDDNFLSDLNQEYATQYLEKMSILATKSNIKKLLKMRPTDKCDFHLTVDQVRNKTVKILHLFPNPKSHNQNQSLKQVLSNEEFEQVMNKVSTQSKETAEDKLQNIKRREVKKEELHLFMPEIIENMINKAKEEINDKKLYLQSHGMIEQQVKVFDLSIENIRKKYLNPNAQNFLKSADYMNSKAKFQNIDKVVKKDIFQSTKFEFPFLDVNLSKEILAEVNKPIEVPMEIIMKDINFILDNFPIDQLIHLDEPMHQMHHTQQGGNKTGTNNNFFNSTGIYKNVESVYNKTSTANQFYKIKSMSKKDVLMVYKKIQSPQIYKIIGLLVNLLYWIVYGFINRVQIDRFTKQHILFKILETIHTIELQFPNKITFDKIFMPILIIVIRIECEAIFHKKFKTFFDDRRNLERSLEKINELITIIFDPNCYFNTFTLLSADVSKLKHKVGKSIYPNYKNRINATSNMVNQLFTHFQNENNVKKFQGVFEEVKKINEEDWEDERKYIVQSKVDFYRVLLNKINQNLKKRNLDPIFKITKKEEKELK
jgi:hypothetical protein